MENEDGKQNLDHKGFFFFFLFNQKSEKNALERDFMTLFPAVGIEIKRQTYFITLLVLSVRDKTVVCRLQHQNTPKNTHTPSMSTAFPTSTHTKQNTQKH